MSKEQISTKEAPAALGPYSQAIRAGEFLFLAGQVPLDPATGAVSGSNIAEQTARALDNLGAVLKAGGLGYADVVKMTVFMTDLSGFNDMNGVYAKYFKNQPPARTTVQVTALPKGVLVEFDAIAMKGKD